MDNENEKRNSRARLFDRLVMAAFGIGMLANVAINIHQEEVIDHNTEQVQHSQSVQSSYDNRLDEYGEELGFLKGKSGKEHSESKHLDELPGSYCECSTSEGEIKTCKSAFECNPGAKVFCETQLSLKTGKTFQCESKDY